MRSVGKGPYVQYAGRGGKKEEKCNNKEEERNKGREERENGAYAFRAKRVAVVAHISGA